MTSRVPMSASTAITAVIEYQILNDDEIVETVQDEKA